VKIPATLCGSIAGVVSLTFCVIDEAALVMGMTMTCSALRRLAENYAIGGRQRIHA
jgi:hypothetical protein